MLSACLWNPPLSFRILEPIFIKLRMYIMMVELISTAYFIYPSLYSVCLCIPLSLLGYGSAKMLPQLQIHRQQQKNGWMCFFCVVHIISEKSNDYFFQDFMFNCAMYHRLTCLCNTCGVSHIGNAVLLQLFGACLILLKYNGVSYFY
jgi:hypothetical protein